MNQNPLDGFDVISTYTFDVISAYTRAQAIEDGFLVDVTETAKEAGIKWPVALTRKVYETCVRVPEGVEAQDEAGRLWDIFTMFRLAVKRSRDGDPIIEFGVLVRNHNYQNLHEVKDMVTLIATVEGGDRGEPVITIMFPGED